MWLRGYRPHFCIINMKRRYSSQSMRPWKRARSSGYRFGLRDLAPAIGYAGSKAYRWFTGANAPARRAGGIVTTAQFDAKRQYYKKKMPFKKKRRWKKFVRKVQAVNMKLVGTRTVVKNDTVSSATIAGVGQNYLFMHLYGINGTTPGAWEAGVDDIVQIKTNDPDLKSNGRLLFGSAVMDITLRNTSETAPVEVDLYEIGYGDETKQKSLYGIAGAAALNTPPIGALTGLDLQTRGVTLFDLPELIKYGKIKIYKKTKVFLPVGNTATYQIRVPKNIQMSSNEWNDTTGFIKPNVTRTLVAVYKPVVSAGSNSNLAAGVTRKYMYKIYEDQEDQDGLLL